MLFIYSYIITSGDLSTIIGTPVIPVVILVFLVIVAYLWTSLNSFSITSGRSIICSASTHGSSAVSSDWCFSPITQIIPSIIPVPHFHSQNVPYSCRVSLWPSHTDIFLGFSPVEFFSIIGMIFLLFITLPGFSQNIFCVPCMFQMVPSAMHSWAMGLVFFVMFEFLWASTYNPNATLRFFLKSECHPVTISLGGNYGRTISQTVVYSTTLQ